MRDQTFSSPYKFGILISSLEKMGCRTWEKDLHHPCEVPLPLFCKCTLAHNDYINSDIFKVMGPELWDQAYKFLWQPLSDVKNPILYACS